MNGQRPIAVITGASAPGRVGLASACALARAGCDIIITHRAAPAAQLEAAWGDIGAAGGPECTARMEAVDLADLAASESWAASLASELPRLDILVHNASIYGATPTQSLTAEDARRYYDVNALAPLLLSRVFAPRLAESTLPHAGAIVTMCDIHAMGEVGLPRRDHAAYAMSKAALLEMTMILARELAPRVRVNAVAPGVVAFAAWEDPAFQERYLKRIPLGRSGTPVEAAEAVRWLALEASYCTGQVIRVDGGRRLG